MWRTTAIFRSIESPVGAREQTRLAIAIAGVGPSAPASRGGTP
jgi:hypothetical protein